MLLTAAYVYLPNHIVTILSHSYYYWAGHHFTDSHSAGIPLDNISDLKSGATAAGNMLSIAKEEAYDAIVETSKIAAETAAASARAFKEL